MDSFLLAIERNNNDYVPIEWNLSSLSQDKEIFNTPNVNIYDLKNIDAFTKNYTETELKESFFNEGILDEEEKQKPLVIIYKKGDKKQKLLQGVINEENKEALESEFICSTIMDNINNKETLNRICMHFKGKNRDKAYSERLESLLACISDTGHLTTLSIFNELANINELTYMEKRALGLFLKQKVEPRIKEEPVKLIKE